MNYANLIEHPEGGRFLEVYRSATQVDIQGSARTALTHIYFSLNPDEVSRWHRVSSDEVWNLCQGSGLYLYQWDGTSNRIEKVSLSAQTMNFCHIVPAGYWQAAAPIEEKVLVGCSVAPGFEFSDFELIDPQTETARTLQNIDDRLSRFIYPSSDATH